jgi:DNA replication protein DnaC
MEKFTEEPKPKVCECKRGTKKIIMGMDRHTDDYYWYYSVCEVCEKEDFEEYKKEELITKLQHESRISREYAKCSLESVKKEYATDMLSSVYFYGSTGVGKTYMAVANFKADIEKGKDAAFISSGELLTRIKSSFKPNPDEHESDIINRYATVGTLYLDDLGADKVTDFVAATFYAIIDRRYREQLKTIITSNLSIKELSAYIGDRITSRIAGMCNVVNITGKDRRLNK